MIKIVNLLIFILISTLSLNAAVQRVSDSYNPIRTSNTYVGTSENQTYSINPDYINTGANVTIIDQGGTNTLELTGGLTLTSASISSNEIILFFSNGASVNVRGADTFSFYVGGNGGAVIPGTEQNFTTFITDTLGLVPPTDSTSVITATGEVEIVNGGTTVGTMGSASQGNQNTFTEDFSTDLSKWTIQNYDDKPGTVAITDETLKIYRTNTPGNGGAVGITMDTNINIDNSTNLLFDAKIVNRDVGAGCGWTCEEYPITVHLTVEDADGAEYTARYGVNYGDAIKDIDTTTSKQIIKSITQNEWTRDISYNLKNAWPNAVKITNIYIYGNGWDFEGYIDNVRITGEGQTVDLNSGLVAHYEFEDNANDSTSNNYDGLEHGSISYVDGVIGKALDLDGIDDWIDTLHSFDLENRTVSVWINTDTLSGSNTTYREGRHALTQNSQYLEYGSINVSLGGTNGDYDLRMNAASDPGNATQNIAIGTWYHLVLIKDGPSTRYYINNTLVYEGSSSVSAYMSTYYNNLVIGTDRHRDRRYFDGKIDDLRIYNRAISQSEISELYSMNTKIDDNSDYRPIQPTDTSIEMPPMAPSF